MGGPGGKEARKGGTTAVARYKVFSSRAKERCLILEMGG